MTRFPRESPDRRPALRRSGARWRSRRWLLAVPVILLAWPPLYNRAEPALGGVPFFYAYQMAVIPIAAICLLIVYAGDRDR